MDLDHDPHFPANALEHPFTFAHNNNNNNHSDEPHAVPDYLMHASPPSTPRTRPWAWSTPDCTLSGTDMNSQNLDSSLFATVTSPSPRRALERTPSPLTLNPGLLDFHGHRAVSGSSRGDTGASGSGGGDESYNPHHHNLPYPPAFEIDAPAQVVAEQQPRYTAFPPPLPPLSSNWTTYKPSSTAPALTPTGFPLEPPPPVWMSPGATPSPSPMGPANSLPTPPCSDALGALPLPRLPTVRGETTAPMWPTPEEYRGLSDLDAACDVDDVHCDDDPFALPLHSTSSPVLLPYQLPHLPLLPRTTHNTNNSLGLCIPSSSEYGDDGDTEDSLGASVQLATESPAIRRVAALAASNSPSVDITSCSPSGDGQQASRSTNTTPTPSTSQATIVPRPHPLPALHISHPSPSSTPAPAPRPRTTAPPEKQQKQKQDTKLLVPPPAPARMSTSDGGGSDAEVSSSAGTSSSTSRRTFKVINNSENCEVIRWTNDGKAGVIIDRTEFEKSKAMKATSNTRSLSGFARQLNMWGFTRGRDPVLGANSMRFSHEHFQRGQEDLLDNVVRREESKRGPSASGSVRGGRQQTSVTDSLSRPNPQPPPPLTTSVKTEPKGIKRKAPSSTYTAAPNARRSSRVAQWRLNYKEDSSDESETTSSSSASATDPKVKVEPAVKPNPQTKAKPSAKVVVKPGAKLKITPPKSGGGMRSGTAPKINLLLKRTPPAPTTDVHGDPDVDMGCSPPPPCSSPPLPPRARPRGPRVKTVTAKTIEPATAAASLATGTSTHSSSPPRPRTTVNSLKAQLPFEPAEAAGHGLGGWRSRQPNGFALTPGPDASTLSSVDGTGDSALPVQRLSTPERPAGELVCLSPEQWPESSVRPTTATLGSPTPEPEPVAQRVRDPVAQPMPPVTVAAPVSVSAKSSRATSEELTPLSTPEKGAVGAVAVAAPESKESEPAEKVAAEVVTPSKPNLRQPAAPVASKQAAVSKQPAASRPPKATAKSSAATNTPPAQPHPTLRTKRGRKSATTTTPTAIPTTSSPLRNSDEYSRPTTHSKRARISR